MDMKRIPTEGFEELWELQDPAVALHGFIAIHSTRRGPGIGGVRLYPYEDTESAITEVKRLAEIMSYKTACAELPYGGAKAVLIEPSGSFDRDALYGRFAEGVNRLKGRYITAIDAGTTPADVDAMKRHSEWVGGAGTTVGGAGDPSPVTAAGVQAAIEAGLSWRDAGMALQDARIAVQGLGSVGSRLAASLAEAGAEVYATDLDAARLMTLSQRHGLHPVLPELILSQPCDVFSPCALGRVLSADSIPSLRARLVAGAANDPLNDPAADAALLQQREVVYCPDFIVNAGGVIHIAVELEGRDQAEALEDAQRIGATLTRILERAATEKTNPYEAALRTARELLT